MKNGVIITYKDFVKWLRTGKVNGEYIDDKTMYWAIQTRRWECPVCAEDGGECIIDHDLDATIEVGNPICQLGHDMELRTVDAQEKVSLEG